VTGEKRYRFVVVTSEISTDVVIPIKALHVNIIPQGEYHYKLTYLIEIKEVKK